MVALWSAWISLGGPEFSHQNTPSTPGINSGLSKSHREYVAGPGVIQTKLL